MTNLSILRQIAKYLRQLNEVIHISCGFIHWRNITIKVHDGYVYHYLKQPLLCYQMEFLTVKTWWRKITVFLGRFGAVFKSLTQQSYVKNTKVL